MRPEALERYRELPLPTTSQEPWRFTLVITPGVGTCEEIDWSALLPSDGSTGWLSPHPEARSMTIDPLSGYPD